MKRFLKQNWPYVVGMVVFVIVFTLAMTLRYNVNRTRFPDAPPWTWFF